MRTIKSLLVVTAVVGLMTTMGVRSFAGPLMPPLVPNAPVGGETTIVGVGGAVVGTVDWFVLPPGDYTGTVFAPLVESIFGTGVFATPFYIYAYQIEPAINDIENWTVNVKGPYIGTGTSSLDLDLVGHDVPLAGAFPNLGASPPPAESEVLGAPLQPMMFGPVNKPDNVTYDFDGDLDAGEESEVLWLLSDMPPTYWIGALSDGLPSPGIGLVPVPSPEPATVLLMMGALLGLGVVSRRRQKA